MKHTYRSLFLISFFTLLHTAHIFGHGFGTHTFVHMADGSIEEIGMLCRRSLDSKIAVASYDVETATLTHAPIKHCGRSTIDRHIQFRLENCSTPIACTLTQEFYLASSHQWIPAYRLQIGDDLLCKKGSNSITEIAYVEEQTEVYMLEISKTHTFFVGWHGALTHNMGLPAAVGLGFSIPFGSAAGGSAGAFFGPVTVAVGAALGAAVGAVATLVWNDSVPTYGITIGDAHYVDTLAKDHSNNNAKSKICSTHTSISPSPTPNGPKKEKQDDDNDDDDMPFGRYADAPYHHPNSTGKKSPCPVNGQDTLNHSIKSPNTNSKARYGVDSHGQFVEFKYTSAGVYHGHVVSCKEIGENVLTHMMQHGLVTKHGDPIKRIVKKTLKNIL